MGAGTGAQAGRRPPTMEDVAARAGVSRAQVSIVLRGAPGAGEATRERVRQAAADLGYRPDSRARLLGRTRTHLLGVAFGVQHAFHGDLVEALYAAAEPAGYDVALSAVAPSRDETRAVDALLDYRCEALVLLGPQAPPEALGRLAARLPTVVVARKVDVPGVDVVRTDDADGLRQAVEHLAGLGHRRITHVDGGRAPGATERRRGYRTTMRRLGLADGAAVVPGGIDEDDGAAAAQALLAAASPPTAVVAFNDRCALGVLETLRRHDVAVPADVSVMGFDDIRLARLSHVGLTTVAQDAGAMARRAVECAVRRLEDPAAGDTTQPGASEVIAPSLVLRRTTGRPRG